MKISSRAICAGNNLWLPEYRESGYRLFDTSRNTSIYQKYQTCHEICGALGILWFLV